MKSLIIIIITHRGHCVSCCHACVCVTLICSDALQVVKIKATRQADKITRNNEIQSRKKGRNVNFIVGFSFSFSRMRFHLTIDGVWPACTVSNECNSNDTLLFVYGQLAAAFDTNGECGCCTHYTRFISTVIKRQPRVHYGHYTSFARKLVNMFHLKSNYSFLASIVHDALLCER